MAEQSDPSELTIDQILATLDSLPQIAAPPAQVQSQFQPPTQAPFQTTNILLPYHPSQTTASGGYEQPRNPKPLAVHLTQPNQQPVAKSRSANPVIDPATITEWKHGLRCVNKIAMQNPNFIPAVQKLMQDQARNVKDWEAGRKRLVEEQTAKRENEKTHLALLSLPGMGGNMTPLRTAEVEEKELEQYNQKVYRACKQMVEYQSGQLKSLGVPFFGVKPYLMQSESAEATGEEDAEAGDSKDKKKVTKKEVLELQRRMLTHLLEMYGD